MAVKIRRIIFWGLVFLLLLVSILFGAAALLLFVPSVQQFAVDKATSVLSSQLETEVSIGKIRLRPFKTLSLGDVLIKDLRGDTLVCSEQLLVNIGGISNLNIKENKFSINELKLKNTYINIYNQSKDDKFNFSKLLDKLSSGDKKKQENKKKKASPFDLNIDKIQLQQTRFGLRDSVSNSYENIYAGNIKLEVEKLSLPNKSILLKELIGQDIDVAIITGKSLVEKEKEKVPYIIDIGWQFLVDNLVLENSNFSLTNTNADKKTSNKESLIDVNNLVLSDINANFKNVRYDTLIYAEIDQLTLSSGDKLKLHNLDGILSFTKEGIYAENLKINLNNTNFSGNLGVDIPILSLNNFVDEAYFNGNIRRVNIAKSDVQKFFPVIKDYVKEDIYFSGNISGKLSNLKLKGAQIDMGENLFFAGDFGIKGLPKINTSILDLKVNQLKTNTQFLSGFSNVFILPEHLKDIGSISFEGDFIGSLKNFVANGRVETDYGSIIADVKMTPDKNTKVLQYFGNVKAINVDLGKFANAKILGVTDFDLHLEGQGFTFAEINTHLEGEISSIMFNNYEYNNIKVDGYLADKEFNGKIGINDDCLVLDFSGLLDTKDSLPYVDCKVHIENADLQNLGFTKEKLVVSLDGYVAFVGNNIENINGDLSLKNLVLTNDNSSIDIDDILVNFVSLDDGFKEYSVVSEPINGFIRGQFSPVILPKEIIRTLSNYSNYIVSKDTSEVVAQDFESNFEIDQDFGLIKFFVGDLESASKIKFKGTYNNRRDDLDIFLSTDSLIYKKIFFDNLNLRAATELGQLNVYSNLDRLFINKTLDFKGLNAFISSTKENVLTNIKVGEATGNKFYQGSEILHYKDSTVFNLLETDILINNNKWVTPKGSKIVFTDGGINVRNVQLSSDQQVFSITTDPNNKNKNLLSFENIDVADIVSIFTDTVILKSASLSGIVEVYNPFTDLKVESSLELCDIEVLDLFFDKLSLDASYNQLLNEVKATLNSEEGKYIFDIDGKYNLKGDEFNSADFDLNVEKLPLDILNLFLQDAIEINADVRGKFKFLGSIKRPEVKGMAYFDNLATVKVPFIGASFSFTDSVWLDKSIIDFGSISVSDPFGNKAFLEGKIEHNYFKDIKLDLKLLTERFNFMNTTIKDNDQFFGKVFGGGMVSIKGPVESLTISGDVKTKGVSTFSIPISAQKDVSEYDYIRFFNPRDTLNPYGEIKQKTKVTGLNVDLRLEVTPDVLIELILSAENNDKITAKGFGNIQVDMNTLGDFNMRGTYTIANGQYILTLQDLIKKPFVLKPGGTVTFNGDVANAELNVDAIYRLRVPLASLDSSNNTKNQRVDIDIDLKLRGTLDKTEVKFDIVPSGSSNPQLQNYLNEIKQDENILNTQVIGLLLFRRFLPIDNTVFNQIGTNFGSALGSNTALEFISIQMSQFLTKAIAEFLSQDIELNVNVSTSEVAQENVSNQTGEVQLDFKYNVMGGRLLFNIGGEFGFGDLPQDIQGQNNNIAGDFLIEYAITEDGRFKIKAFHRTSQYDLLFNKNISRTGVGISYQRDFDKAKELFATSDARKRKKERKKEKKLYKKNVEE